MSIINSHIIQAISPAIDQVASRFRKSPYSFLFESDIQASLYSILGAKLAEPIRIPGSGHPENHYDVNVVNSEYKHRFDIACLDIDKAIQMPPEVYMGFDVHIYKLPVLVGIEIKYCKMTDAFGFERCLDDLNKLREKEIEYPVVLGFVQNDQMAESSFFKSLQPHHLKTLVWKIEPINCIHVITPLRTWRIVA